MALLAYAQPRAIQGFGSLSCLHSPRQGMIAGCSHAVSLLKALLWRSLLRLEKVSKGVGLRLVVDDTSMQWLGQRVEAAVALPTATAELFEAYKGL
eukprot:8256292-Lingulodinium_polyedra.AAC.1